MITLKASTVTPTPLDEAIDRLFKTLEGMPPESPEYSATADQLLKLHKLRDESTSKKRVSPDTLASVAGSLTGIFSILLFEKSGHVIVTKAFSLITKLR